MKLRIEKAIYGGASLARVPCGWPARARRQGRLRPLGALPGELVEATIATDRRSYITATLDSVLEPAPSRITPGCEYYGRCGGCHYQHADYAAQLAMKRSILIETLERAHVPLGSVPSGDSHSLRRPLGLSQPHPPARHRILIRHSRYREAASHRDLPVTHCPVAAPILQQAIAAFNQLLQTAARARATHLRSRVLHHRRRIRTARLTLHPATQIAGRTAPIGSRRAAASTARTHRRAHLFARPENSPHPAIRCMGSAIAGLRRRRSALSGQRRRILSGESLPHPEAARRSHRTASRAPSPGTSTPASGSSPRHSRSASSRSSPSSPRPPPPPISPAISAAPGHKRIAQDTLRFLQSPPARTPRPRRSRPATRRPRRRSLPAPRCRAATPDRLRLLRSLHPRPRPPHAATIRVSTRRPHPDRPVPTDIPSGDRGHPRTHLIVGSRGLKGLSGSWPPSSLPPIAIAATGTTPPLQKSPRQAQHRSHRARSGTLHARAAPLRGSGLRRRHPHHQPLLVHPRLARASRHFSKACSPPQPRAGSPRVALWPLAATWLAARRLCGRDAAAPRATDRAPLSSRRTSPSRSPAPSSAQAPSAASSPSVPSPTSRSQSRCSPSICASAPPRSPAIPSSPSRAVCASRSTRLKMPP